MRSLLLVLTSWLLMAPAFGQEFAPPRPPPLEPATDFEDMEEDMGEPGDDGAAGFRPPPPPPPPPSTGSPGNMPMPPDIRPPGMGAPGGGFGTPTESKPKFKIVEGEYWEKGKKRTRGPKTR